MENSFIEDQYEIHIEKEYIMVKDLKNVRYLKLSGKMRNEIIENLHSNEVCEVLHRLFDEHIRKRARKKVCIPCIQVGRFRRNQKIFDIMFCMTAIIGGILFTILFGSNSILNGNTTGSYSIGTMILWTFVNVLVHELGHVVLCHNSGRKVHSFGLKMNYGMPMVYVDTTDICMAGKINRIKTSLGGVYFNALLFIAILVIGMFHKPIYFEGLEISYFFVISNSIPFLKLDGYYVLADCLDIMNLNKESKNCFWSLLKDKKKSKKNYFLVSYYVIQRIFFLGILIRIIMQLR